mmetsp:Transcript_53241/g.159396  ORF Transcript_53241/g.159396 Transcript_53241/m.159396 type:complete len:89 (+) Transcript_53241:1792-2058(+)
MSNLFMMHVWLLLANFLVPFLEVQNQCHLTATAHHEIVPLLCSPCTFLVHMEPKCAQCLSVVIPPHMFNAIKLGCLSGSSCAHSCTFC